MSRGQQKYTFLDKKTEYSRISQEFYDGTDEKGFSISTFIKLKLHDKLGGSKTKKIELYFKKLIYDRLIYEWKNQNSKNIIDPYNRIYFWTNLAEYCFGDEK